MVAASCHDTSTSTGTEAVFFHHQADAIELESGIAI